ncbi:MAG: ferredoxin [Planctomycetes bacterium]|nr:ferredoxin [Planctomycetota bacterium]
MRVYVDPDLCSGCGPCVDTCPEVFDLNDDGIAFMKVDEVPEDFFDACRDAADGCPSEAIVIEE